MDVIGGWLLRYFPAPAFKNKGGNSFSFFVNGN